MLSTTDYKRHDTHEKKKFMSPLLCFLNNVVVIASLKLALCLRFIVHRIVKLRIVAIA